MMKFPFKMVPFSGDMLIFGDVISGIPSWLPAGKLLSRVCFPAKKKRVKRVGCRFHGVPNGLGVCIFPHADQRSRCFLDPPFSKEGNLEPPLALLQSPVLRPAATWVFGRIDVGSLWMEG